MKKQLVIMTFLLAGITSQAQKIQEKVGTNPTLITPSAVLEVESTTQGFLLPRMTTAQRTAIASPAAGLHVYDTSLNSVCYFNGTTWQAIAGSTATSGSGATVAQTVVSPIHSASGKIWMDRNLGASRRAQSVDDFMAYGQLYQWGRGNDGHADINWTSATAGTPVNGTTSTQSTTDYPDNGLFITGNSDWRVTQNNNLWQGANGINNPCPVGYRVPTAAEFTTEVNTYNITNIATAFASPLKFVGAGHRHYGGNLGLIGNGYYRTATVNGTGAVIRSFYSGSIDEHSNFRASGFSVRCISDVGTLTALDCAGATHNGSLTPGTAASGVSSTLSYTGGSGGSYAAQSIASTGVTGLTATLTAGTFASGTGSVTYTITGTPSAYGLANFAISLGGQSCTLTRAVGIVDRAYGQTINGANNHNFIYATVTGADGKTWLNNNLGAHYANVNHASFNPSQQATGTTDHLAYGSLFQWGRGADGHELITYTGVSTGSPVNGSTSTLSNTDTPANNKFIYATFSPVDWRSPQNNNLWQGVNGTNNPCPTGYRVPTEAELTALVTAASITNSATAASSTLKFTSSGSISYIDGSLIYVGVNAHYWSSSLNSTYARRRTFYISSTTITNSDRANGYSVRCIKD